MRGRCGLRDSVISQATAATAITTTGTLIRNTEPHQKWSSSQPPRIGPIGKPRTVAPPTIAMALGRSAAVNITGSTASDSGRIAAAARPSTARAAISCPAEPA